MIPWFIVSLIAAVASMFGRDTYVRATSGNWWGAEAVYLQPRGGVGRVGRIRRLGPCRGGPIEPGGPLAAGRAIEPSLPIRSGTGPSPDRPRRG